MYRVNDSPYSNLNIYEYIYLYLFKKRILFTKDTKIDGRIVFDLAELDWRYSIQMNMLKRNINFECDEVECDSDENRM